ELLTSHFNAFILMEMSLGDLSTSVDDLLDTSDETRLEVKQRIKDHFDHRIKKYKTDWITQFKKVIHSMEPDLYETWWYSELWLERKLESFKERFDSAFNRWRNLYQVAKSMNAKAHRTLNDPNIKHGSDQYKEARRQYNVALKQVELLTNQNSR